MTATQLKQTEAQFEQAVTDYSKLMGWLSYHALDSRGSAPGFPDRVFLRAPRLLFVEFKTETGRVSPEQERWLDELERVEAANQHVETYVWRPAMWGEIQAVLR
jgi:hypothetical protein